MLTTELFNKFIETKVWYEMQPLLDDPEANYYLGEGLLTLKERTVDFTKGSGIMHYNHPTVRFSMAWDNGDYTIMWQDNPQRYVHDAVNNCIKRKPEFLEILIIS